MIYHCPTCNSIIDTDTALGLILVLRVEKRKRIRIYAFCRTVCLKAGILGKAKAKVDRPSAKPSPKPRPNKENIKLVLRKKS
jgi:hypothetical protein